MQFMKPNRSWSVISTLFRKSYKTKKSSNYQMQKDEEVIHVQGEILYGVYSVKMALKV